MKAAELYAHGPMDSGMGPYTPGVHCIDCGRFEGRDGWIEVEFFEMSNEIASVAGQCRRCVDRELEKEKEGMRA